MIFVTSLSFVISLLTDHKIDELFCSDNPNIPARGDTNLTARYSLGGLLIWAAFGWLTQDIPEPWRTKARKDFGMALLLVGIGTMLRRLWEAIR